MTNNLLIIDYSKKQEFEAFFQNQKSSTQVLFFEAKSTSRNFLLNLLNLSDAKKCVYFVKANKSFVQALQKFAHQTLNKKQSGLLVKFKKEQKQMENTTPNKPTQNTKYDKLVVAIIKNGFLEIVLNATKGFELSGATILNAKGIGQSNTEFMGMDVESHREVVLIATTSKLEKKLITTLKQALKDNGEANGVMFSLPIENFVKFDKNN